MVLFLALGWAVAHYLGVDAALPVGAVVGLLAARLVPARSCAARDDGK